MMMTNTNAMKMKMKMKAMTMTKMKEIAMHIAQRCTGVEFHFIPSTALTCCSFSGRVPTPSLGKRSKATNFRNKERVVA